METLYIFTDGELKRKNHALYFVPKSKDSKPFFVPLKNISSIMIFSEVSFNKKFLGLLAKEGIPTFFYGYYGDFIGSFYPPENNKTGEMIVLQFQYYYDLSKRLEIAKEILESAVLNMLWVLNGYKEVTNEELNYIVKIKDSLKKQNNIPALMAIEGNIRKAYYKALGKIVKRKGFDFDERLKRPPKDEINALISFGNIILYNTVLAEIYKTSLEPRISFLHETNKRKFSLQLDIAEIFKPIIVDKAILKLVNKKEIKKEDFNFNNNGVFLYEDAKKKFINEIEERLNKKVTIYENQNVTFKTVIRHECYKLVRHLKGVEKFKGFVMG